MTDESGNAPLAQVRAVAARQLGRAVDDIDPDATFFELGADSLLLVGMIREIEREVGVRVSMRELFADGDTPRGLSVLITQRIKPLTTPIPALVSPPQLSSAPAQTPSPAPAPAPATPAKPPTPASVPSQVPPRSEPTRPATADVSVAQTQLLAQFAERVARRVDRSPDSTADAASVRLVGELADLIAAQLDPPAAPISTSAAPPAPPAAAAPTTTPTKAPATPEDSPAPAQAVRTDATNPPATLDYSVYFFGDYPRPEAGETVHGKYELIADVTKFADANGFHTAWLPERHFHSFGGLFPNPSVLAAALSRQTSRIRLHAGSVVLPLHNTIRVAEEWSVVDNLSDGRAGVCIASGWHANDFAFYPERFGKHRDVMYEQLADLRRLWRGEALPVTSGNGEPVEVQLYPEPIQDMPPLFAAVVGNPDSYRLAARNDLGIVTNLMTQSIEQLTDNIALYRQTRAECGLDPAAGRVVVLMHTYVGDDLDRVRQEAFEPFCGYMRSSLGLLGQATNSLGMTIDVHNTPEDDLQFMLGKAYERYCQSRALIGTPQSCAPIAESIRLAGADEIACFVDFGVPADLVRAGLPGMAALRETSATSLETAPLSYAQERFWLAEQMFPGHSTYNEARAIRLTGELDVDALRTGLSGLVDRQAALRTVIRDFDGEPRQVVLPESTVEFEVVDHLGEPEEQVVEATMSAQSAHRFDLANGPLFRAVLLRFSPDRHVLFINAHHTVIDSVSGFVLARELSVLYRKATGLDAELPPLPVGYADYAREQRSRPADEQTRQDLTYWRDQLQGPLPVLNLPTDRPRPAVLDPVGASLVRHMPEPLAQRARRFSQQQRTTLFMTLLSALSATLRQLSGQDELVVGVAVADRPEGTENLIGAMLNTLPMRVDTTADPAFTELLRQVRDTAMDAFGHGGAPFEEILKVVNPARDTSRTPLFQTLVVFENEDVFALDLPGVESTLLDNAPDRAIYDLTFYLTNGPHGIRVHIEYNTLLFDESTVDGLVTQFELLLDAALNSPDAPLSTLHNVTDRDRERLEVWQHGPATAVPHAALGELVTLRADAQPDAIAVEGRGQALTYAQLVANASTLAGRLVEAGVRPGDVVAVRLPRCAGFIVAQLAIHLAHGVCMPIDPLLPEARVGFMLEDSGCRNIVSDTAEPQAGQRVVRVTQNGSPEVAGSAVELPGPADPRGLAYLFYTSGSSGAPKGVLTAHRGMVNTCAWYIDRTGLSEGDRTTVTAALGFDMCVLELWSALISGATIVLPTHEARRDPQALADWLAAQRIDVAWLPTTLGEALLELPAAAKLDLRFVTVTGSALRRRPPQGAGYTLLNAYGPTEASMLASQYEVAPGSEPVIPIGRPLPNTSLFVLDAAGRQVPVGTVGELHIGGIGLAEGYLNRPELDAEKFVIGPVPGDGRRLYRTGDLARWNSDGELEYLGRNDDQVKIRGFRIEPGEVAATLLRMPGVKDADVVAQYDGEGDPHLAAFLVMPEDPQSPAKFIEALSTVLPEYMVPRRFAFLAELPRNANGKTDRAALPQATIETTVTAPPATDLERRLHELWCQELGAGVVDTATTFFDLGGDSLAAARLLAKVRSTMDAPYPLIDFFRAPTIAAMAARLSGTTTPQPPADNVSGRTRGSI